MRILSFLSSPTKLLLFLDTTKLFRNVIQKSRHFFGIGAFFWCFLSNSAQFEPPKIHFSLRKDKEGCIGGYCPLVRQQKWEKSSNFAAWLRTKHLTHPARGEVHIPLQDKVLRSSMNLGLRRGKNQVHCFTCLTHPQGYKKNIWHNENFTTKGQRSPTAHTHTTRIVPLHRGTSHGRF